MDFLKFEARTETNEVAETLQANDLQLTDLQLALVGGGIGDVQHG